MQTAAELAREHWNETPLYYAEAERYRIYPWLYATAEFEKHADEKVLEIGCGTGCDLLQFAKHGARAYGIDITDAHLRLARQRVKNVPATILYGEAARIPFDDSSFDYVYSHGVIHHCDDPRKVVSEIFRVLRPGGRYNVHVYAKWSFFPAYLMLRFGTHWRDHIENSAKEVKIDLYTASQLRELFGPGVHIDKQESRFFPKSLGWYLIATGSKAE